jgi:hypothetical protein
MSTRQRISPVSTRSNREVVTKIKYAFDVIGIQVRGREGGS